VAFLAPSNRASFSTCVTDGADSISIAGIAHQSGLGGGVPGFVVDVLGGNAFSGITNLVKSFGPSGEAGDHSVFYNMGQSVIAGPTQGFGPLFGKAIEGTPFAADIVSAGEVAVAGAETASGIGVAKLAYDGLSTLAAGIDCALGVIH
jgi:hypothetical protein